MKSELCEYKDFVLFVAVEADIEGIEQIYGKAINIYITCYVKRSLNAAARRACASVHPFRTAASRYRRALSR